MALHIHRCARTDALVDGLATVLAEPLTDLAGRRDPFLPETVSVPTRGVERFLTQQLGQRLGTGAAGSDGVCARVAFPSPTDLFQEVTAEVLGPAAPEPEADPWHPSRLAWMILDLLDPPRTAAWHDVVTSYLSGPDDAGRLGRRLHLSRTLADLFHRYGTERPQMIADWAAGADTDGFDGGVPADLAWQLPLWRAVREELGVPALAERMSEAAHVLAEAPELSSAPARLSLFGPTRIAGWHRQMLGAVARHREVHLWVPDASPPRWTALAGASAATVRPRIDSGIGAATRNSLLRSLGRDSGELSVVLQGMVRPGDSDSATPIPEPGASGPTMLAALQAGITHDLPAAAVPQGRDRSVQIHDCHGRPRQVEVLREAILGLLQTDPTLEPRDILIMTPDVAGYAPLITAAFGADDPDATAPAAQLRVRVADRTSEQANHVLVALDRLLAMAWGRFTAAEVMDFAALPAVRARFGLDDDALERLTDLVDRAGIRWGLDAADRTRHGIPESVLQNTWAAGMDRLLLGVAMGDDQWATFGSVLPVPNLPGGDTEAVATLAELVDRLRHIAPQLRAPHQITQWHLLLRHAVLTLTGGDGADSWQQPAALAALDRLAQDAGAAGSPLDLADIRLWLADLLTGRPTRSNFRSGGVTVCSLAPMRAVPYRVICLLGLDDGVFPRHPHPDGDDITARLPRVGERDAATEDRQLFLDAIMAATDHLVITYAGRDLRTNRTQPPAVPVGELLDTLAIITGCEVSELVVRHPLQPFDPSNFTPGALVPADSFSHDQDALTGALALRRPPSAPPRMFQAALAPPEVTDVALADLIDFLSHPPRHFLRQQLGLAPIADPQGTDDQIPVALDALQEWRIGDRILAGLLHGTAESHIAAAEKFRGDLPPGGLGHPTLLSLGQEARSVADQRRHLSEIPGHEVAVAVSLPSGIRLTGVVPGVADALAIETTFTKVKAKSMLAAWVRLLALQTHNPDRPHRAVIIGRGGSWSYDPVPPADAGSHLDMLVAIMRQGLREPLPFMPDAGREYARRRRHNDPAECLSQVAAQWVAGADKPWSEAADPVVRLLWGEVATSMLTGAPGDGLEGAEPSRFATLARLVWDPPLHYGHRGSS